MQKGHSIIQCSSCRGPLHDYTTRWNSQINRIISPFAPLPQKRCGYWKFDDQECLNTAQIIPCSLCTQSLDPVKVIPYHFLCCNSNGFRIFHHSGLIINKSSFWIWRCTFIQLQDRGKTTALKIHNKQHTLQATVKLYYTLNSVISLKIHKWKKCTRRYKEAQQILEPRLWAWEMQRMDRAKYSFWAWGLILMQDKQSALLS